jgi:hypothetical protein
MRYNSPDMSLRPMDSSEPTGEELPRANELAVALKPLAET